MTTLPTKLHLGHRSNLLISNYGDLLRQDITFFKPNAQNVLDSLEVSDGNITAKNVASLFILHKFSLDHQKGDEIPNGIEIEYGGGKGIQAFIVKGNRLDINLLSRKYFGVLNKYKQYFETGREKLLPMKVFLNSNLPFEIKPETLLDFPKNLQVRKVTEDDFFNFINMNVESPSQEEVTSMILINRNIDFDIHTKDRFLKKFRDLENRYRDLFDLPRQDPVTEKISGARATSPDRRENSQMFLTGRSSGARATSPDRSSGAVKNMDFKDIILDDVSCTTAPFGNAAIARVTNTDVSKIEKYAPILQGQFNRTGNLIPPLKVNTFGEIRKIQTRPGNLAYTKTKIVMGIDSLNLASMEIARNGVLQVASQFNFLESPKDEYAPISEYYRDFTQGPRASLSVPLSLLMRDRQFVRPDPSEGFFRNVVSYRNGYYQPASFADYFEIDRNIDNLPILIQDGFDAINNNLVTQVFCAAPSFQGSKTPEESSIHALICNTLISAQYEAIARVAVHKSIVTNSEVPLHLTLVGQGAFKNNKSAITNGIMKAISTVGDHNVKIYIHVFDQNDFDKLPKEIQSFL